MGIGVQSSEFKPKRDYKTNRSNHIRWILSHIFRYKYLLIFSIILQITARISQSIIPVLIGNIVTLYDDGKLTLDNLTQQSILILIIGISIGIQLLLTNLTVETIGQRIERDARDELYGTLLGKSQTFHDKQQIGDLMSRAATDVRMLNLMMNPGYTLVFASIIGAIMPLVFISLINTQLLIIPTLFLISYIVVLRKYNNNLSPWSMKSRMAVSKINSRLNETLVGMHVVRGNAMEEKERGIFKNNILEFKNAEIRQGSIRARYWPLLMLGVARGLAILHAVYLYDQNVIGIGDIIAFILLLQLLNFPTFINIFAINMLTLGVASSKRILELIKGESLIDDNPDGYNAEINGNIIFDNVTFGYSNDLPVLKNISFKVAPGQTVAFVGMTGSGKSTITKLISRLYDPQQGSILIDGIKLKDWSINALRSQMALVEQDIFLFSKSIKDNITLGMPSEEMETIINASKFACAHQFIQELPEGYDTIVGERGITLSGGQRQRIAIARAIIRNPRILVLDDASSAIDSKTEDEINLAIREVLKNRVSFLITHRIAQIRKADLIILLDQGKILDQGNHKYLLQNSEKYRAIFGLYDETIDRSIEKKEVK